MFYIPPHSISSVLMRVEKALLFYSGAQEATQHLIFLEIENE